MGTLQRLLKQWGRSAQGDDPVFAAGFQSIAVHLARGLNIATGQRVTRVDCSGRGVQVTTDQGSLSADAVVVAVPLGVLKAGHISFTPALPEAQAQVIQGKLAFAGEATHPDPWGVAHGACLSGQRAARQRG